jgi:hypothetical protein
MRILKGDNLISLILTYAVMILVYVQTSSHFEYMGFGIEYSGEKVVVSTIAALLLFFLNRVNTDNYMRAVSLAITLFFCFPVLIYYQFNNDASIDTVVTVLIFLGTIVSFCRVLPLQVISIKKTVNMNRILIFLAIGTLFLFYPYIDLGALFSTDIYTIRLYFRGGEIPIYLGYVFGILSRVVFPFLLIYSLLTKRYILLILILFGIYVMFSFGALKSVVLGGVIAIAFYFGSSYRDKMHIILNAVFILFALSLLEEFLLNTYVINDFFTRRIFFTPALLQNIYFNEFESSYTMWMHTPLSQIFDVQIFNKPITFYIGEDVMGIDGHNASIGIMTEGYISYGYLGVFFHSLFISFFFILMRGFNIRHEYFGIIITYIYIARTSFIFPLMASHMLSFLILFAWIFMSEKKINKCNV